MLNYLKCLLQLILSPGKGWEDISYEGRDPRVVLNRGYYALLVVVALSSLMSLVYDHQMSAPVAILHVPLTFLQYFVSYYIAMFVFGLMLTDYIDGDFNYTRTATYTAYLLGLVSVVSMLENLLPMDVGVLHFLPIYIAVIAWKGAGYMAVRSDRVGSYMLMTIAAVIVPPYLLGWLFDLILG